MCRLLNKLTVLETYFVSNTTRFTIGYNWLWCIVIVYTVKYIDGIQICIYFLRFIYTAIEKHTVVLYKTN